MQGMPVKHGADFRAAERQAEMPGSAGVHGIHGEAAGFIGGPGENFEI